eukprot:3729857-Pyramimonas_sp.AAC.1
MSCRRSLRTSLHLRSLLLLPTPLCAPPSRGPQLEGENKHSGPQSWRSSYVSAPARSLQCCPVLFLREVATPPPR